MILDKDNYELIMFDLLEGNLSEAEELLVMDQIEGDEFFFREWKLFKATVLVPSSTIVFSGKASLYKEGKTVTVLPMRWPAIAASVCILASVLISWPRQESKMVHVIAAVTELKSDSNQVVQVEKQKNSALKNDLNENRSGSRVIYKANQKVTELGVKQVVTTLELEQTIIPTENRNDVEALVQTKPNIIQAFPIPKLAENQLVVQKTTTNTQESKLAPSRKEKAMTSFRIKELIRLKNNISDILVMASNPKLNINTDFKNNRPSIQLELETKGYQAIASLEPFKNRN
jgi:hypothetical protein